MQRNDRTLNRISISTRDLEKCKMFLNRIDFKELDPCLCEALLFSIVITYARPFSTNERDKASKAEAKLSDAALLGYTSDEKNLHKKLLNIRNKCIAHSEFDQYPTGMSENGIFSSMNFSIAGAIHAQDISAIKVMVKKLLDYCHGQRCDFSREAKNESVADYFFCLWKTHRWKRKPLTV